MTMNSPAVRTLRRTALRKKDECFLISKDQEGILLWHELTQLRRMSEKLTGVLDKMTKANERLKRIGKNVDSFEDVARMWHDACAPKR